MAETGTTSKHLTLPLPPELRNYIYELVLSTDDVTIAVHGIASAIHPLVAVSRQTRAEVRPMIQNWSYVHRDARDFKLHVFDLGFSHTLRFLRTLNWPAAEDWEDLRILDVVIHLRNVDMATVLNSQDEYLSEWIKAQKDIHVLKKGRSFILYKATIDWNLWTVDTIEDLLAQLHDRWPLETRFISDALKRALAAKTGFELKGTGGGIPWPEGGDW